MKSENEIKELSDRFINDTMFVRTIFCHPGIEQKILGFVDAPDIHVYTSNYLEPNCYIVSKDIKRELKHLQTGINGDDFKNNTFTIIMYEEFT